MKKVIKALLTIIIIILELISMGLIGYALFLYSGVETFYRILGIIIIVYLFLLLSYLLLRSIKKKKLRYFIIPLIITLIVITIEFGLYYYLNKIYKTINMYSNNNNMYHTSLVTYDKTLKNEKDLKDKKIGVITDKSDIEGYTLPQEIITNLKLKEANKIVEYSSTMELLTALKSREIDAAFFSSNYVDMFYTLEGYEEIETETKVLYQKSKQIKLESNEEENTESTLTKPFNVLLIGVDSSQDGVTSGYNGDVLLLISFNPKTLRATITSVPRDMYLKTACSGGKYRRINTTTWGSTSDCAVNTIESLFDVDIKYYAKINFKGVVNLVDAVGGIDVKVDYAFCEQNSSRKWGSKTVFVEKGMQHLNGEQALALARNRHSPKDSKMMAKYCPNLTEGTRSDYTRGKNQMKVIMGVVNSATKLTDPNQAIDILEKISKNFQTNVKTKDVLSLYNLGKSLIISDTTELINIERLQLSGYNAWGKIYDPDSKSYPAVTIPYQGSINDIKDEINIVLGKKKLTPITKIKFDINNLYKDTVGGNGKYASPTLNTLKSLSGMSVSQINSYASNNGLNVKYVNIDTNETLSISDFSEYSFYSQKEHKDILIDQLNTITVYVKKRSITPPVEEPTTEVE